jgi:hypothetical protein
MQAFFHQQETCPLPTADTRAMAGRASDTWYTQQHYPLQTRSFFSSCEGRQEPKEE